MFKWLKWIIGGSVVIAVIILILFLWNQNYDSKLPIDTGLFGTYGDFIGGVLGTVIALYTAFLLVKTFLNQININRDIERTNASVVEANNSIIRANVKAEAASHRQFYQSELQLFDSKFRSFLYAYQNAINHYTNGVSNGRIAFEEIALSFVNQDFNNNNDYKRRSNSATDEYLMFYAEHQTMLSVHLRMLYLLVSLISKSKLTDEDKVQYAKLVRGQMSNMEMLIERYNCLSTYGEKMQKYCNQYNLIKHLPVLSLLEFKSYKNTIVGYVDEEDTEKKLSGLNTMFILLRKKATRILDEEDETFDEYKTSHSYSIELSCLDNLKRFVLVVHKDKTAVRRGGGIRISPEERALDSLDDQIVALFRDYLYELFIVSNFDMYNHNAAVTQEGHTIDTANEFSFKLVVSSNERLVLSYSQMKNRDYPVEALEN